MNSYEISYRILLSLAFLFGLLLDVANIWVGMLVNRNRFYISSIPLPQPIMYLLVAVFAPVSIPMRLLLFILLIALHLCCRVHVPNAHATWFNGRGRLHRAILRNSAEGVQALSDPTSVVFRDNAGVAPLSLAVLRERRASLKIMLQRVRQISTGDGDLAGNRGLWFRILQVTEFAETLLDQPVMALPDPLMTLRPPLPVVPRLREMDYYLRGGFWYARPSGLDLSDIPDAQERDEYGWSLLHEAALLRQVTPLKRLIELGLDANVRDNQDWTPLHVAAFMGYGNVVEVLLRLNADVNATNDQGRTPLMLASAQEHRRVVRLLTHHGAFGRINGLIQ